MKCISGLLLLLVPIFLFAQITPLSGTVKDGDGKPMPGVSVLIKGKKAGAQTDESGRFSINASEGDVLLFSYVGFEGQQIKVTRSASYTIILKKTPGSADEIVVVGYGTRRRRDITGSVATAPIADMDKAPVGNFTDALEGRVSGVVVSSSDGQPGSLPNIVIRGNNSVTQDNSPLYVIDGFPIMDPNSAAISPEDIASIEILKDASATAIYGARGANGVIIITTKRGKTGAPVMNFSTYIGFQDINRKLAMMSPYDYVSYERERDSLSNNFATNASTGLIGTDYVTDATYLKYWPDINKYKSVPAADMQDLMYGNAPMENYALSLSGGTDKTQYMMSGNIFNQDGIMVNSGYSRYQGRLSLDQVVDDHLKVGINANYAYLKQWGGSPLPGNTNGYFTTSSAPAYAIYGYNPTSPLDSNGHQTVDLLGQFTDPALYNESNAATSNIVNPYINQINTVNQNFTNDLTANAYAEYKILPSLTLRVTGGLSTDTRRNIQFYDTLTGQGSPLTSGGALNGVNGSVIYYQTSTWINENMLTYDKVFAGSHHLNILGDVSESGIKIYSNGTKAVKLPNPSEGVSGLDEGTPSTVTATSSNSDLASFLGRINYDFKSRYYLTASFRADGSSRFASGNKWGYFPSGAFKWRFIDENFLKRSKVLSDGNLRISYGQTGNNNTSDFPYLTAITTQPNMFVNKGSLIAGAYPSTLANKGLKWETTDQTDIGTDLGFFNNRITLTADVYKKTTRNLLLNATIPSSLGFSSVYANVGSVQNQGLELNLTTTNIRTKSFTWSSSFNISWNQNKVLALAQNQESMSVATNWDGNYGSSPAYIAKVGQPLGQLYGLAWNGVYQYGDFNYTTGLNTSAGFAGTGSHYVLKDNVPANGNARAVIQPGDIKYKDLNGDGVTNSSDYTIIGRGLPIHTGGFGNNLTYKRFDLNVFFQWSYGENIQNAARILFEGNADNSATLNQFASYNNRWSATNTHSNEFRIGGYGPTGYYSSRTVEDGSYLRLKTVQVGYTIPAPILKKLRIRTLRVYASAQNLFTWTRYSGQDPEISTYNSVLTPNFDWSGYPRARTATFGANLSF